MWGHAPTCPCSVCKSLPRIFSLIQAGGGHLTFVPWVGDRLRVLEAECRDELQRLGPPPGATAVAAPLTTSREGGPSATGSPPKAEVAKEGEVLQTTPKVKPPEPPENLTHPDKSATQKVKEEPPTSPPSASRGVEEVADGAAAPSRSRRPEGSHPRQSRRDSKESRRERSRRKSRDRDTKSKRRTRSRSRRRRSKSHRPADRGRSRKKRSERPPEPDHPPPQHSSHSGGRPPEPAYPPPGRGWIGVLPRSDHPRWHQGENKGQVKRAKQERFNNRRRR